MALPETTDIGTIILGPYEIVKVNHAAYVFPVEKTPPIKTGRTKVFPGHATVGPTDPDFDDTLNTFNVKDLSGGSGIYRINASSDAQNYWWGVASVEGTDGMTSGREAIMRKPAVYEPGCVPLGRIGTSSYALWGTKIHQWDPDTLTWGAALGTIGTVINTEGIATFNGKMYFPLGDSGYARVGEVSAGTLDTPEIFTGDANPTYETDPDQTSPRVLMFQVHRDLLWAITTSAQGHAVVASPTGNDDDWHWEQTGSAANGDWIKIDTSFEPRTTAVFPNQQNDVSLWVAGRRGLKVYISADSGWQDTNLTNVPPHPDFGKAMAVFRPGEALHIAGGGGDIIQYTIGGNVVPASGPGGGKEGMPARKQGSAISFASDLFHLYALYKAIRTPNDPDALVEDTPGDDPIYIPQFQSPTILMANNGKGWHPVWESDGEASNSEGVTSDQGVPTKVVVSDAEKNGVTDYRVFWNVGSECWTMTCRLGTHSSRQAIKAALTTPSFVGERFRPISYIEWGQFYGTSIAANKLWSHMAFQMDHADAVNYAEYSYSTERFGEDNWQFLGVADHDDEDDEDPRIVLPFGVIDNEFSQGISSRWLRQRVRLICGEATAPPIITSMSLAYLPLTQDAATKAYTIPLPVDVDNRTNKTAEVIINTLESIFSPVDQGDEKFLYMQEGTKKYRAMLSSVTYARTPTNDGPGSLNITVIQIPSGKAGLVGER